MVIVWKATFPSYPRSSSGFNEPTFHCKTYQGNCAYACKCHVGCLWKESPVMGTFSKGILSQCSRIECWMLFKGLEGLLLGHLEAWIRLDKVGILHSGDVWDA